MYRGRRWNLNRGGGGGFRWQIDADGLFLRLNLAGFACLWRSGRSGTCWRDCTRAGRNVRIIFGHIVFRQTCDFGVSVSIHLKVPSFLKE